MRGCYHSVCVGVPPNAPRMSSCPTSDFFLFIPSVYNHQTPADRERKNKKRSERCRRARTKVTRPSAPRVRFRTRWRRRRHTRRQRTLQILITRHCYAASMSCVRMRTCAMSPLSPDRPSIPSIAPCWPHARPIFVKCSQRTRRRIIFVAPKAPSIPGSLKVLNFAAFRPRV